VPQAGNEAALLLHGIHGQDRAPQPLKAFARQCGDRDGIVDFGATRQIALVARQQPAPLPARPLD
jgi:hypothetical protein